MFYSCKDGNVDIEKLAKPSFHHLILLAESWFGILMKIIQLNRLRKCYCGEKVNTQKGISISSLKLPMIWIQSSASWNRQYFLCLSRASMNVALWLMKCFSALDLISMLVTTQCHCTFFFHKISYLFSYSEIDLRHFYTFFVKLIFFVWTRDDFLLIELLDKSQW